MPLTNVERPDTARKIIESEYKIIAGTIFTPGKFESCDIYAPWFYEREMHGDGESVDIPLLDDDAPDEPTGAFQQVTRMKVHEDERLAFPELEDATHVDTWEDEDGFYHVATVKEST
jgi:hypothetical protein